MAWIARTTKPRLRTALVLLAGVAAFLVALYVLLFVNFKEQPRAEALREDVILVHGWPYDASNMQNLADYLAGKGYAVHNLSVDSTLNASNITNAQTIVNYVNDRSLSEVSVIGHSMGGIALRYAIKELRLQVKTYISIDSPHYGDSKLGACLAWAVHGEMCKQPLSEFMQALNAGDMTPGDAFYLSMDVPDFGDANFLPDGCQVPIVGDHIAQPSQPDVQAKILAALRGTCP